MAKIWTLEKETKLMELAEKYLSEGLKTLEAFEKISKELGISNAKTCRAKYYVIKQSGGLGLGTSKKRFTTDSIKDKERLLEIVTETINNGGKVSEGLRRASQELGYPYVSCKGQWENSDITKSRDVKDWTLEEDNILIETVLRENKKGMTMHDACLLASKKLNRTVHSCTGRWSNEFRDRYNDQLDITRPWSEIEKQRILTIISRETKKGLTLGESYKVASKELGDRTFSAVQSCYTNELRNERLDYDISIGSWLEEESKTLKNIIFEGTQEGNKIEDVLKLASEKMGKTYTSVRHRWYYYVLPNNKEEYAKIRTAKNGRLKFGPKTPRNLWTKEEENILMKIISTNLKNKITLKDSYEEVSKLLGDRSINACSLKYGELKKKIS